MQKNIFTRRSVAGALILLASLAQSAAADTCATLLNAKWNQATLNNSSYSIQLTTHLEAYNQVTYSTGFLNPDTTVGSFSGWAQQLFSDRMAGSQPFNINAADSLNLALSLDSNSFAVLNIHYNTWNFDSSWTLSCQGSVLTTYGSNFGTVTLTFRDLVPNIDPGKPQRPSVRTDVHHDLSPAVRDLPKISPGTKVVPHDAEPVRRIPLPPGLKPPGEPDSALQKVFLSGPTPSGSSNFPGLGQGQFGFNVGVAPPDPNGAVGLTQYVQMVNSAFAVFDKTTGALLSGPTFTKDLWKGFGGGCETKEDDDGIALYDKLANRWVLTRPSHSTTPYLQCVAVSTTSDATGKYNRYAFQYPNFNDYGKMGLWPDAYYATFNMFPSPTTGRFLGATACAYDRNAMLNGQPATQVCFRQSPSAGALLPADLDGAQAPPVGSPNFMLSFGSNNLQLFKFHVDFATPAKSTFTGPTVINVAPFSPLCNGGTCVPQPGVAQQLDSLADRLMYRLAYRNFGTHESLVVNHSVAAGSSGGLRWYEIQNPSGAPVVAQQSTFAPDPDYRWMGSIAMDQAGDIALGYSQSGATMFPAISFTGRAATDPLNQMSGSGQFWQGGGSQQSPLSRWGDYSALQVDPVDDCTFWYTQEYLQTSGIFNWSTRIFNFKFPNCSPQTSSAQLFVDGARVLPSKGGSVTVSGQNFIPGHRIRIVAPGIGGKVVTVKDDGTFNLSGQVSFLGCGAQLSATATDITSTPNFPVEGDGEVTCVVNVAK